jgi:hypothetical protein
MKSFFRISLLSVLTAIIVIISCQKSDHKSDDNTNKPVEYVSATISGRILDNNKQPVNGAVVKAGSQTATTDINGNFRITNVTLDKNAGFIKIEKDGFFQGSRTIVVNANAVNYVSIELIKRTVSGTVSGSSGGNITVTGGGNIAFTGNSFVNTAGNSAYTGTVSVSTFYLNPTAGNFNQIMPGTLRGITTGNEETGLQSFGMMAVELTGAGGEKLQLAAGKTATLTFPIPAALQAQAPNTIPLWSFNETTGLWKEEGTATKQGTNYVGTVSHFSFWNCDYPYNIVDFKAMIKDQNGNGVYPALVTLKTSGDTVTSYGYGYTDSTGFVGGKIPKGKTLQMKVYNKCNEIIYTKDIGPFSADADLGTITISIGAGTQYTFSGTVVNCTFAPVTNGLVDISIDSMHHRAVVSNGSFSTTVARCNNAPATAVLTAYDLSTNQSGPVTNVAVNSTTVNAGQLNGCGTPLERYLFYTLDGNSVSFASAADSVSKYGVGTDDTPWAVSAWYKNGSTTESVSIRFAATGLGTVPLSTAYITYKSRIYVRQSTINLNITEFVKNPYPYGTSISGNFTGMFKDSLNPSVIVPVTLTFKSK